MSNNTTPRGALTQTAILSERSRAGTDYVRPGVVDQSGYFAGQAEASKQLGKQMDLQLGMAAVQAGGEAIYGTGKAIALSGLNDEVQGHVDDFLNSARSPETAIEASALNLQSESLWSRLGDKTSPSSIEDINTTEEKYTKKLNMLARAHREGAITSLDDLEARVLKATREAVNRTPGLAQELMQQSAQILHLSGVRSMKDPYADLERAQAKQEAEMQKRMFTFADAKNIHYDQFSPDMEKLAADINEYKRNQQAVEQANLISKEGVKLNDAQKEEFVKKDMPSLFKGYRQQLMEGRSSFIGTTGEAFKNEQLNFQTMANFHKADLARQITEQNLWGNKEVKLAYDVFAKNHDELVKTTLEAADGTSAERFLSNKDKMITFEEKRNLRQIIDPTFLDAAFKLHPQVVARIAKNEENLSRFASAGEKLVNGIFKSPLLKNEFTESSYGDGLNNITSTISAFTIGGNSEVVGKAFDTIREGKNELFPSPEAMVKFHDQNFEELAKPEYAGKVMLDEAGRHDVASVSATYLDSVAEMFKSQMAEVNRGNFLNTDEYGNIHSVNLGDNITAEAVPMPDGRIEMRVKNAPPGFEKALNVNVAKRYNDVIKAYSNLTGMSPKDVANQYNEKYKEAFNIKVPGEDKALGKRGQNENNPLNLKNVGENSFKQFSSKEEGIKASYNQLLKYNDGSSANVDFPLSTPEQMLKVWNNAAEKGSASDKQYASNVARYSGLDLSKPIDPSDTDSWVDLLYGMSVAEGGKVTRKEIRTALQ